MFVLSMVVHIFWGIHFLEGAEKPPVVLSKQLRMKQDPTDIVEKISAQLSKEPGVQSLIASFARLSDAEVSS